MDLDTLINEANFEFLNNILKQANSSGKGMDLFAYENARQARIEKQIEAAKKSGDEEKVKQLKKKLSSSDLGTDNKEDRYSKAVEDKRRRQLINALKGKICMLMMDYCNLTSGVGLNGDSSTKRAVQIVKGKKDENGNQQIKVVGAPTLEELNKHYNALKDAVEQLYKYEHGYINKDGNFKYGIDRKYFEDGLGRSKALKKALENIKPEDVSFEINSKEVPFLVDSNVVKTGEKTGKKTGTGADEKYAEINGLKYDSRGNLKTDVWKTKMAKVIGKKRFNAFVYEELYPFIREFQRYRSDWDRVKHPENITKDFIANDVNIKLQDRQNKLEDYVNGKGKFSDFKKAREIEQQLTKGANKKTYKDENGNYKVDDYHANEYAKRLAIKKLQGGSNKEILKNFNIGKVTVAKVSKIIREWMSGNHEPGGDYLVKLYGSMPGSGGQTGAGVLIFMKQKDPEIKNQLSLDGWYAYQAPKKFMDNIHSELEKYVENHVNYKNHRAKDEWQKKVAKLFETSSIQTEEINYFNY